MVATLDKGTSTALAIYRVVHACITNPSNEITHQKGHPTTLVENLFCYSFYRVGILTAKSFMLTIKKRQIYILKERPSDMGYYTLLGTSRSTQLLKKD